MPHRKLPRPDRSAPKGQLGTNLARARLHEDFTQKDVAEIVGCAWTTISEIERGHVPSLRMLARVCEALDITLAQAFEGVELEEILPGGD